MPSFNERVQSFIRDTYPDCDEQPLLSCKSGQYEDVEETFRKLKKRYARRKLYSLNGVLEEAKEKFNALFIRIETQQFMPLIRELKSHANSSDENSCNYLDHILEELEGIIEHKREKVRSDLEFFSALSFLLSLTDIIISVILIVGISYLSHFGQAHIEAATLGALFLVLVAFFKVTLDRFVLTPWLHKKGWRVYRRTLDRYEDTLAKVEAIVMVATHSIEEDESILDTLSIIHKGIDKLESN